MYSAILCYQASLLYFAVGVTTFGTLQWQFFQGLSWLFYSLAQIFVYMVLYSKLHHTPFDTNQPPSPRTNAMFESLIILYGISCAIWICTKFTEIARDHFTRNTVPADAEHLIENVATMTMQFVDVILSFHFIAVITVRLRNTQRQQHSIYEPERPIDPLTMGIKHFVLLFFFTVSIQIESMLLIICSLVDMGGNQEILHVLGHLFWPILMPFECMLKTICLSLIMNHNEEAYHTICFVCHSFTLYVHQISTERRESREESRKRSVYRGLKEDMQVSLMMDLEIHKMLNSPKPNSNSTAEFVD